MIELVGLFFLIVIVFGLGRIFIIPLIVCIILFFFVRKKYSFKKVRLLIIITFVFLSVIFSFIFPFSDFNVYKKTNPKQLSDCDKPEVSYKGYCLQEFAIKKNDMSVCYLIKDDYKIRKDCFHYFRKKSGSISFCENFDSLIYDDLWYKSWCYSSFAYELKDSSICQLINPASFEGFQKTTIESIKTTCLSNFK